MTTFNSTQVLSNKRGPISPNGILAASNCFYIFVRVLAILDPIDWGFILDRVSVTAKLYAY